MRYPEVDLTRLLAMLLMAIYHLSFDLAYFYGWPIPLDTTPWRALQQTTLILFLLVSGISAVLLRQKLVHSGRSVAQGFAQRGLIILVWALAITLATRITAGDAFIRFGVLHSIAVTTVILPLVLPLQEWNALIGIAIIALGWWMGGWTMGTSLLIPFGIMPPAFATLDYVPLIPWSGVILLGSAIGSLLYVRGWRSKQWHAPRWMQTLSVPGRYALAFYLMHQPVMMGILFLILGKPQ